MSAFVTRKALSRRTVLRGVGAAIALPLLDSMVPAFAATPRPVRRFGAVYVPNGMNMTLWTPKAEGALEFTPVLRPLEPYQNRVLVLSGLANKEADARPNEGGGDHIRAQTAFLTGVRAKKTDGA